MTNTFKSQTKIEGGHLSSKDTVSPDVSAKASVGDWCTEAREDGVNM